MSDLNDEKRMEKKNSPTLSDMPIDILTKVVNELDFGSRTKLQKTCHGFQDFINSHYSTCEEMILTFKKNQCLFLEWSIDQFKVQYIERRNGCSVKIEKEEKEKFLSDSDLLEIGFADFKSAIKNPNFKIKKLFIQLVVGVISTITDSYIDINGTFYEIAIDYFFDKLSKTLESLDQKLKVEKVNIHTYNNEKYAISILQFIKPEKFDGICLGYCTCNTFHSRREMHHLKINQLKRLEQWKMAKTLKIFNLCLDIPIESIIHFDQFAGSLKSLSPENIVFLKEVYLQSATFKQCFIQTAYFPQIVINIEAVNQLLGPVVPFDQNHPDVRHYAIPNSNQWLLMEITLITFHIYKTDSPNSYLDPPTLLE